MTEPLRILVTGNRHWDDVETIAAAISHALHAYAPTGPAVLVHGGAPGADTIADEVWDNLIQHGMDLLPVEVHPADWRSHGRKAGPIRNAEMVRRGAVVCLAFPVGNSPGTRGCMAMARAAGIPVIDHDPALREAS